MILAGAVGPGVRSALEWHRSNPPDIGIQTSAGLRATRTPEISVRYPDVVRVTTWSHDTGGLSPRDLRLARAVNELFDAPRRPVE